jgi:hypothetical protein
MTIKKAVTQKVVIANRQNGQLGNGPTSVAGKSAVAANAIKHGLLAKRLTFRNEAEKTEFDALMDELQREHRPEGVLERMALEEIGVCWWKLQMAQGWELEEIRNRREASTSMIRALVQNSGDTRFPLFQREGGTTAAVGLNWDCNELLVRSSKTDSTSEKEVENERESKTGRLAFEAKLTSSMDTILRYQAALKRDLYKAIHVLAELQATRTEASGRREPGRAAKGR